MTNYYIVPKNGHNISKQYRTEMTSCCQNQYNEERKMDKKNENRNDRPVSAKSTANRPDALVFPGRNQRGINNPDIALPAFNPPVPNRAWTAMRMGKDIDELTEQEKRDLYYGKDGGF